MPTAEALRKKQEAEEAATADPEIDALVAARTDAKKAKNFAEADRIRDQLKAHGCGNHRYAPGREMEKSMKLMILDGNSVINRAYFGVKPLTTRDGLYTHAVYGFLNISGAHGEGGATRTRSVLPSISTAPPSGIERYEGYKANRHGMPEELAQQMPVMKQVLTAMNIPIYVCPGLGGRRRHRHRGKKMRPGKLGLRCRHR